jgi:hypothetical protein
LTAPILLRRLYRANFTAPISLRQFHCANFTAPISLREFHCDASDLASQAAVTRNERAVLKPS